MIMTGALFQLFCVLINLQGQEAWNFVASLVLLGVGWNFLLVGGTSFLISRYIGAKKAAAQGFNHFLVFGTVTVTVTALGSGALHHAFGWDAINLVMAPIIAVAFGPGFWLHRRVESNSRAVQPT